MSTTSVARWATFAGGVLLGSAIVGSSVYIALKYAPNLLASETKEATPLKSPPSNHKRRTTTRSGSPVTRHPLHGNARRSFTHVNGDNHEPSLVRTDTELYYQSAADGGGGDAALAPPLAPPGSSSTATTTTTTTSSRTPDKSRNNNIANGTNGLPFSPIPNPQPSSSHIMRRSNSNRASIPLPPPPAPAPPTSVDDGPYYSSPTAATASAAEGRADQLLVSRIETYSETEPSRGHGIAAIFAGPADRANPAVHEALRHTVFVPEMSTNQSQQQQLLLPSSLSGGVAGLPNSTTTAAAAVNGLSSSSSYQHYHHTHSMSSPSPSRHHHNHPGGEFQRTPGSAGTTTTTTTPPPMTAKFTSIPSHPDASPSQRLSPLAGHSPSPSPGGNGKVIPGQLPNLGAAGGAATGVGVGGGVLLPPSTAADALATEGRIIEDAALHEHYSRVILPDPASNEETDEVCWMLQRALDARHKWLFKPAQGYETLVGLPEVTRMRQCIPGCDPFAWIPEEAVPFTCEMVGGVMQVCDAAGVRQTHFSAPGSASDFFSDMHWLLKVSALGHVRSFTHNRLQLLEQKFNLHVMLNADKEFLAQKSAPHRDFYNVRKIDTHVHHSACMHQKHLLRFIKSKLKKEGDEVVIFRDGKYLTLKEVFESLNLTPYDLSVDTLDVHADKNIFHRFDKFNLKYNPFGQSRLREVFIKQDNLIHGRYLAELTREVFNDLEVSKYQHTEYRISVYGRKPVEWDTLAAWVVQNRLYSDNNIWMIQVPRLYNVYKEQGIVESFQQLLDNLFDPLFEVTLNPSSHPMLHVFLRHVSGFDLVDDESKPERRPSKHNPAPPDWTSKHNPAFAYYAYYMYANLYVLNKLREARGLNTFSLRPHAGEAGDLDHLVSTFLLAENIAHGINLRKSPCLQYLYYAAQVGLCMSPLSNNSLFLDYHRNPFPQFFARGLSVSLSTDDPLQIHLTREPLVEEYSVAAQVWKFSGTDLCEVARNSVLHSGFPARLKQHWVHTEFWRSGPEGNSIQKTNVPALRMVFRKDCHSEEVTLLASGAITHEAKLRVKEQQLHAASQE